MKFLMTAVLLVFGGVPYAWSTMGIQGHALDPPMERNGRLVNAVLTLSFAFSYDTTSYCNHSFQGCEDQSCERNCLASKFDHLVVQSLDEPQAPGQAVAHAELSDDNPDGHIGSWGWSESCGCQQNNAPPCSSQFRWEQSYAEEGEGIVYLTLPCGRWRIYYVMTSDDWDVLCVDSNNTYPAWGPVSTRVMKDLGSDGNSYCFWRSNLTEFVESLDHAYWSYVDVDMGDCNIIPPGDAELTFNGYVRPGGGDGKEWLPTPRDSIGLSFTIRSQSGQHYRLSYAVGEISLWRGQCLNSPRFAPEPAATGYAGPIHADQLGQFSQWDFTLCQPQQYNLIVYDTTHTYIGWESYGLTPRPGDTLQPYHEEGGRVDRTIFTTAIIATTPQTVDADTLWLKAWDYAAHCVVFPHVMSGGGKQNNVLRNFLSPYDGERLYSLTVPYDYDGLSRRTSSYFINIGANFGDGMSDYWEDTTFRVTDPRPILPFITFPPHGGVPALADSDYAPTGRNIKGDYLCNFEEYRGAIVSPRIHKRFDPLKKTVFIHLRTNLDSVVKAAMPGYIYNLNTGGFNAELCFVDSMKWGEGDTLWNDVSIEQYRRNGVGRLAGRSVDFNREGASHFYLGYAVPTGDPTTDSVANAITWWRWNGSLDSLHAASPPGLYGITVGPSVWPIQGDPANGGTIPRWVIRSCVALSQFEYYHARPPYSTDTTLWNDHFPRVLRKSISHEVGHGIGMIHGPAADPNRTKIMNLQIRILDGPWLISDSTYADSSKNQFSTRGTVR